MAHEDDVRVVAVGLLVQVEGELIVDGEVVEAGAEGRCGSTRVTRIVALVAASAHHALGVTVPRRPRADSACRCRRDSAT